MDNFDLRKYLAEGKLLKENIDFPELEDEFEGAMDAMVVKPEVYLKDILNASADDLVSDDYYEIMNAVEQGVYSKDEAVKLAKSWAKEKLSTLGEGKLLKEDMSIEDVYNDAQKQVKDIYDIDVPMNVVKQWADNYQFPYSREVDPEDEDQYILVYDFGTEERGDFMEWLKDNNLREDVIKIK